MPYKSTAPLEDQVIQWRKLRSSLASTTPARSPPALSSKRNSIDLEYKEDESRKKARIDESPSGMDLDGDFDVDMMTEQDSNRWIAVGEDMRPLLGFALVNESENSPSEYVGLSRYAIDVDAILRYGFGAGDDDSVAGDLYRRFRPCGVIRNISFAERFNGCSIAVARITFEDGLSGLARLSYEVGNSMRRLWVKRVTYTSQEWTIIPEHQRVSAESERRRSQYTPLIDICRNHPCLQYLSDEEGLPISPLPSFIPLTDLPPLHWSETRHKGSIRQSLKSQNDEFDASRFKSTRD